MVSLIKEFENAAKSLEETPSRQDSGSPYTQTYYRGGDYELLIFRDTTSGKFVKGYIADTVNNPYFINGIGRLGGLRFGRFLRFEIPIASIEYWENKSGEVKTRNGIWKRHGLRRLLRDAQRHA